MSYQITVNHVSTHRFIDDNWTGLLFEGKYFLPGKSHILVHLEQDILLHVFLYLLDLWTTVMTQLEHRNDTCRKNNQVQMSHHFAFHFTSMTIKLAKNSKLQFFDATFTYRSDECMYEMKGDLLWTNPYELDTWIGVKPLEGSNLKVTNIQILFSIPENYSAIHNLRLNADRVNLDLKIDPETRKVDIEDSISKIAMPFAHIGAMMIEIEYSAKSLHGTCSLQLIEFVGDSTAYWHHIHNHAKSLSFIGYMIFSVLSEAGKEKFQESALAQIVCLGIDGLPIGAIPCHVTIDFIRRAIQAGKEYRGVSKNDPYVFGDFLRGTCRLPGIMAKKGALLRRGNCAEYKFGDFTFGLTSSLSKYMKKNSAKFASSMVTEVAIVLIGPTGVVLGICTGAIYNYYQKVK
jgi:hypothetical protein